MDILKKIMEPNIQCLHLIKTITEGEEGEYDNKFMKAKFNLDDNLPLDKMLKLHMLTVIVRFVFQEDGKYYPQFFQMNICVKYKCQNMTGLIFQKELILTKQMH